MNVNAFETNILQFAANYEKQMELNLKMIKRDLGYMKDILSFVSNDESNYDLMKQGLRFLDDLCVTIEIGYKGDLNEILSRNYFRQHYGVDILMASIKELESDIQFSLYDGFVKLGDHVYELRKELYDVQLAFEELEKTITWKKYVSMDACTEFLNDFDIDQQFKNQILAAHEKGESELAAKIVIPSYLAKNYSLNFMMFALELIPERYDSGFEIKMTDENLKNIPTKVDPKEMSEIAVIRYHCYEEEFDPDVLKF